MSKDKTMVSRAEAHEDGRLAAAGGRGPHHNPFSAYDSFRYDAWNTGWLAGRDIYLKSEIKSRGVNWTLTPP